jgi:hypothetical protein
MIVRLVNPTYEVRRRRKSSQEKHGGEGGFLMAHHRRKNPFASGSINQLAVKVAGAIGGAMAAGTIPSMVSPTFGTGWAGVGFALAIGFAGAWLLKGMSPNLAEGVLIGGSVNAVSRAVNVVTGRTLTLGQYAPLNFTIPTPAYSQAAPAIAASASKTSGAKTAAAPSAAAAAAMGMIGRGRGYSKYVS